MTGPQRVARAFDTQRVRWQRALGQVSDASSEATLYTCPKQRVAQGRVYVTNRDAGGATFTVRLKDQAGDDNKQFLAYNTGLDPNAALVSDLIYLEPDDSIEVTSSSSAVSFSFAGYTEPKDS